MENEEMHIVFSRNVVEFVTVANEYTKFLENANQLSKKEFILKLHMLGAFLYQKASMLPHVEPETDMAVEKYVSEEDYNGIKAIAELKLGTHEEFIDVYEPIRKESKDAIQVSLAECFADVYQDLKDFVFSYRQGLTEIMNDALYECRINFEQFWGQRLLAALGALHNLVYGEDPLEEEDSAETPQKYETADKLDTSNWLINNLFDDFQPPDEMEGNGNKQ